MKAVLARSVFLALGLFLGTFAARSEPAQTTEVLHSWYKLSLELVRHTPTYTPPVASRTFAYLGVAVYEVEASGSKDLQSLAGQLNDLKPLPQRQIGKTYDDTIIMHAAMSKVVQSLFQNTGPTGQHVMRALAAKRISTSADKATSRRSQAYGRAIADHILAWAKTDGGAVVENLGFPAQYNLATGPAHWVPTSVIRLQQSPLLPNWGKNRTFAMPSNANCTLPPPLSYSEDPSSDFYKQANEVYQTVQHLTPEQRAIARFWADDAMTSTTPPGHWISIVLQISEQHKFDLKTDVDIFARLGVSLADSFIGCWTAKYQYDLVRPVTYIKRVIDPKWEPPLLTPPFPEYPSGHSTQSGAAATVLTKLLGDNYPFRDETGARDNLAAREFSGFWDAAKDAGISRLYGGIHFRAAIERGLEQGRCIGAFANALRTKK